MWKIIGKIEAKLQKSQDFSLLLLRLILAYGFLEPATSKLKNFSLVAETLGGMGFPLPWFNAIVLTITESVGVFLLSLGLMTRAICLPLMFIMFVAVVFVHLPNGFHASNHGFEIPLYYFLMLFALASRGPGRFSLDHLLAKKT